MTEISREGVVESIDRTANDPVLVYVRYDKSPDVDEVSVPLGDLSPDLTEGDRVRVVDDWDHKKNMRLTLLEIERLP
jgi:hypothetical protein